SADGLFLTLTLIEDRCQTRAAAFARTWVHSLSAVSDGGVGMIPSNPWIQVTLPSLRFAMSGGTDAADVHTFDQAVAFKSLIQIMDPMGFEAPCATDRKPFTITPTVAAFEAYLRTLPLQLTTAVTTVDGTPGKSFDGIG